MGTLERTLFIVALVAYAVVVVFAVLAYWLRDFETGPSPANMVLKYVKNGDTDPAVAIRQRTAENLVVDFHKNEEKIRHKVTWTRLVLVGLVAQAVLLVVVTVVQLFWG